MIRAAVLGSNVSESRSPAIHNAAFKALGIDGHYEAISVEPSRFRALVKQLGRAGHAYLNVTIPHKRAAALLAARPSALVKSMAAANTLIFRRKGHKISVQAENTDGFGLMAALADARVKPAPGQIVVMLGAGGAAAGGLAALVSAGATVRIVARRLPAARALQRRFGPRMRTRIEVVPWTPAGLAQALQGAVAVISSVPADAFADPAVAAGLESLPKKAVVLEMAYGGTTPLASFLKTIGAARRYQDGLAMLVHQAARAVELTVGRRPPIAPLLRAARRAVARV